MQKAQRPLKAERNNLFFFGLFEFPWMFTGFYYMFIRYMKSYIVCCMLILFSNEEFRRCYSAGTAYHAVGRSTTLLFMPQGFPCLKLLPASRSNPLHLHCTSCN